MPGLAQAVHGGKGPFQNAKTIAGTSSVQGYPAEIGIGVFGPFEDHARLSMRALKPIRAGTGEPAVRWSGRR